MKLPYCDDPDEIVRDIRASLLNGNDGCRVTVSTPAMAAAVRRRLTPLERPRVAVKWADFPQWDYDDRDGFVELTHNELGKQ